MTQLTIYVCDNAACPLVGVPYQLRETLDGKPLVAHGSPPGHAIGARDYTVNCNHCGEPRRRDASTTLRAEST